jgi:hypothetical protein
VANVKGHTHDSMRKLVHKFGGRIPVGVRTTDEGNTAILVFRTREDATLTLNKGIKYHDAYWPKMQWSRATFVAFGNAYTTNPTTPTKSKVKGKEEARKDERGKDWQSQEKEDWDWWSHSGLENYTQWYDKATKVWHMNYSAKRHAEGPEPGTARGEPWWIRSRDPFYNQWESPEEPFPAEVEEAPGAASGSGYNRTRSSRSAFPKSAGKGKEKSKETPEFSVNKGGPGIPHKSEEGKIEDDPPQEFLDAVNLMRAHRRKSWHNLCQKEVTRAIKSLGDDEDDTKGAKKEKEFPSEHGASSSEEEDESKEYKEEEGKRSGPQQEAQPAQLLRQVLYHRQKKERVRQRNGKKRRSASPQEKRSTGGKRKRQYQAHPRNKAQGPTGLHHSRSKEERISKLENLEQGNSES